MVTGAGELAPSVVTPAIGAAPAPARRGHVCIIVQNLPVPFDRRVWLECRALVEAGYGVSVVCPQGPGDAVEEVLDGVHLYKYPTPPTGTGAAAYAREYAHSFAATARLVARAWRRDRFDVLQACNPPDIFWPLALALRVVGVRFVFDHHDLCPELYEAKFGTSGSVLHRILQALEWCTFQSADHVVSTNESYRAIALERGSKRPTDVTVVRTGPDPGRMQAGPPRPALRRGRQYLVVYLGVMGPQDGVDLALRAADHVVHRLGRSDVAFTFIGGGESYDQLIALRRTLGLEHDVELPGRLPDAQVAELLSTADAGLCPDPKNPLNDLSTMNKTMEYMAYGLPVVAFDLRETRVSAGDAAVYATPNEVPELAASLIALLDDEPRRRAMGERGRQRVVEMLAWSRQQGTYVAVYDRLLHRERPATVRSPVAAAS
ncbi:MAG: glycosyltransferase family 4 protein [Acidimicrobiales bacterium]